jgi:hypothetical protein
MAVKLVRPGSGDSEHDVCLELKDWEWQVIRRALRTSLARADRAGDSTDLPEIRSVMEDLGVYVPSHIMKG